jgi:hypothetical protein
MKPRYDNPCKDCKFIDEEELDDDFYVCRCQGGLAMTTVDHDGYSKDLVETSAWTAGSCGCETCERLLPLALKQGLISKTECDEALSKM